MKRILRFWQTKILLGAIALIAALDLLLPPPLDRAENFAPLVTDRNGVWLHAFINDDDRWRLKTELDAVDPIFVERLIEIEDKRYWSHWGFDPAAMLRASVSSAKAGRIVSGASTITMQTARLLEPRPRNLGSKLAEILRAVQIERRLSKKEILELYLSLAPYGGNLEGVRAASLAYFDKEPIRLTDAEQALLIALPQAPEARRPDLRQEGARAARAEILDKMQKRQLMTATRAEEAKDARLPSGRKKFERRAFHVADRLARTNTAPIIQSTIDADLQARAEALLKSHIDRLDDGVTASIILVDIETRAVRASVGSSGLDIEGGWIDLTSAVRSPGSTLKPFIYALAFEDGVAGPSTLIDDMPRSFGGYTPENFDRSFRGEVRVREALQHSLNLPAVGVLDRVGAPRFEALMRAAGVLLKTPTRAEKKPGLALALGGAGITAQDIAALYAALGDKGEVSALAYTVAEEEATRKTYQLFSEATAARISAILADAPALEGRAPSTLSQLAPQVAFKTGTSYGYRDAWAAGHAGGYAAVVWVGRPDGAPRPGATGRKAAAPLLFDIFDMLARERALEGAPAIEEEAQTETPQMLARFRAPASETAPEIVFPRNGVEIFMGAEKRGYAFAARGGAGDHRWYVNGQSLSPDQTSGRTIWSPEAAGFYDVTVVDANGRAAHAKVRVVDS